jgi:hypothetical protein
MEAALHEAIFVAEPATYNLELFRTVGATFMTPDDVGGRIMPSEARRAPFGQH